MTLLRYGITTGCAAAAVVLASVFVWLFTYDVYVEERSWSGGPAFCGSAYDVALIKHDGYMGGEIPPNQAAIDRACVLDARVDVGLAALAGLGAVGTGALGARRLWKHSGTRLA